MYALVKENNIVEINEVTFEVHSDLFWVEIMNYEREKKYEYRDGEIVEITPKLYVIEV